MEHLQDAVGADLGTLVGVVTFVALLAGWVVIRRLRGLPLYDDTGDSSGPDSHFVHHD